MKNWIDIDIYASRLKEATIRKMSAAKWWNTEYYSPIGNSCHSAQRGLSWKSSHNRCNTNNTTNLYEKPENQCWAHDDDDEEMSIAMTSYLWKERSSSHFKRYQTIEGKCFKKNNNSQHQKDTNLWISQTTQNNGLTDSSNSNNNVMKIEK